MPRLVIAKTTTKLVKIQMISLNYFDSHDAEIYHCALMFLTMPPRLDPFQAADKQAQFKGRLKLTQLERIASESLTADEEVVELDLQFTRDAGGKVRLTGTIDTRIQAICQRCLQPFWLDVQAQPHLILARRMPEADAVDDEFEPLVVDDEGLDLMQLVDEELMLNLPIVAMHPEGECKAAKTAVGEDELINAEEVRENPFAVLAALKDSNKLDQ